MPRKRPQPDVSAKGPSSSGAEPAGTSRRRSRRPPSSPPHEPSAPSSPDPDRQPAEPDRHPDAPPSPLPWHFTNEDDARRYDSVSRRPLFASKYIDNATLNFLELAAEVEQYVSNIGWREFVSKQLPSYKEITRELICSFNSPASHRHSTSDEVIFFQCMGARRRLCLEEVRVILGFPSGDRWFIPSFNVNDAWCLLSGEPKWVNGAKSTSLLSPALRYLHRVLVHSIFGRVKSTGHVSKPEVFVLWCMVSVRPLDGSLFFIRHLASVAGQTSGPIRMGGMVTALAQYFGFDPDEAPQCTLTQGSTRVDLDTLASMAMIRKRRGTYYLVGKDGTLIPRTHPHDQPYEDPQPADDESGASRMFDADGELVEPVVQDILQKRQWVSVGRDGAIRLDSQRPPHVPIRPTSAPSSSSTFDPDFMPVTPMEGSTYLMAKRMDRLAITLEGFRNSTVQQMDAQQQQHQQLRTDVRGYFDVVNKNIMQLAVDVTTRFDWMSAQLRIPARPPPVQPRAPSPPPAAVDTDTDTDA